MARRPGLEGIGGAAENEPEVPDRFPDGDEVDVERRKHRPVLAQALAKTSPGPVGAAA